MDYTSIPRSLVYKEKTDLSVFTRNRSKDSLEYQYFKKLKQQPFIINSLDAHEYTLKILNNACYICGLVLFEEQPVLFFKKYLNKAACSYENAITNGFIITSTLALVSNWLNTDWYRDEYASWHYDDEPLDEVLSAIYSHFNRESPFNDNKWIKEIFLALNLGKGYNSHNLIETDDISFRDVDDILDNSEVSIKDIIEGIDYICLDRSKFNFVKTDDYYFLSMILNRLENETKDVEDVVSPFLINNAFEKVQNLLHRLGYQPKNEVKSDHVHSLSVENVMIGSDKSNQEIERLRKECEEWKRKYEETLEQQPEKAYNAQTGSPCFTSKQMGILMQAIALISETPPPGKTTIGEVVERISGYKAATVNQNMKGSFRESDIEAVAKAIESKFPSLAAKVKKL